MSDTREKLTNVYREVRKDIDSGSYDFYGTQVKLDQRTMMRSSERWQSTEKLSPDDRMYEDFSETLIYVKNKDFVDMAELWSSDLDSMAILNPSSASKSGGGVRTGSRALEEIICRRSNLLRSLEKFSDKDTGYYTEVLKPTEAIWSPHVSIYRDSDYNTVQEPSLINVISAAAINKPRLDSSGKFIPSEEKMMKKRMRTVFRLAITKGITRLILPAWGCGAFGCPAKEVARMFDEVIHEEEFWGAFEEICFAILDDHNAKRETNLEGNYKPFLDRFGTIPY